MYEKHADYGSHKKADNSWKYIDWVNPALANFFIAKPCLACFFSTPFSTKYLKLFNKALVLPCLLWESFLLCHTSWWDSIIFNGCPPVGPPQGVKGCIPDSVIFIIIHITCVLNKPYNARSIYVHIKNPLKNYEAFACDIVVGYK